MRVRKLDSTGDMIFGRSNEYYIDTPEAVAQNVMTRLKLWRGQWFLDNTEGMPWLQEVLGKKPAADVAIRMHILDTYGVTSIDEFETIVDPDSRLLSVSATISTIYGQTTISGVLND